VHRPRWVPFTALPGLYTANIQPAFQAEEQRRIGWFCPEGAKEISRGDFPPEMKQQKL